MFRRVVLLTCICACVATSALGETPAPTATPKAAAGATTPEDLVKRYEAAWNKHDLDATEALLTEDATWVNVLGAVQKGRATVMQERAKSRDQFTDSVWTAQSVDVALIKPDVALVQVVWSMRGDRNPDGSAREGTRSGVLTLVAVKQGDTWKIRSGNNTNRK